jgi:hypothetical protein
VSERTYELRGVIVERHATWAWVDVNSHMVRCDIARFVSALAGDTVIIHSVVVDDTYARLSTILKVVSDE